MLLAATPSAWALAPVIVIGVEALAGAVLQMAVLVIVCIGNIWAFHHIRRAVTGGRYPGRGR
jgi:hypothetical protein